MKFYNRTYYKKVVTMHKPGYKTTEFWTMVVSIFFGYLILTGKLDAHHSDTILRYINNIVGSSVTIISAASYIISRGKAKGKSNIDYEKLLNDIKSIVNKDT